MLKIFLFVTVVVSDGAQRSNPIVRVAHGVLQGSWKVSTKGRIYASFQGVPYARPPIGEYRFREPQQLKPWTGVWDATRALPACLQYNALSKKIIGSENCLFVNVHTPVPNPAASLPVLVFIHGGAFMYYEGGPSHLMDRDIVVVTMNYRLGPLAYQSDPILLQELESQLASNISEYNDTLPLDMRSSVAAKIKLHYFGGKPVGHLRAACSSVCHADDVLSIFKYAQLETKTREDLEMIESLINIVYSYASTGIPKVTNAGPEWVPVKPGAAEINYLEIFSPTKSVMKSSSDFGQKSFWDNLGFIENANCHINYKTLPYVT